MSPELLENLRQRIVKSGLKSHTAAIESHARPAIHLCKAQSEIELGHSRFGGAPDLPASITWPRNEANEAQAFLLQLNLAELPRFEGNPFPESGIFYVFLGLDEPASDVAHQLILWKGDEPLQTATLPDQNEWVDDAYFEIEAAPLNLNWVADVPHWASQDVEKLFDGMTSDEQDAFCQLPLRQAERLVIPIPKLFPTTADDNRPIDRGPVPKRLLPKGVPSKHSAKCNPRWLCEPHLFSSSKTSLGVSKRIYYELSKLPDNCLGQLLGHVHGIGHEPREDAVVVREHDAKWLYDYSKRAELDMSGLKNWTNLLTLFSDYDLNFGVWDAGYLNFLIRQTDLSNLDFSKVYAAVESS